MTVSVHTQEQEDLAAGYALGALDDAETQSYRLHLTDCETCQRLVAEYRAVASLLPEALNEMPASPRLKQSLMAQVRVEPRRKVRPAAEPPIDLSGERKVRRPPWAWFAALAASLLVAVGMLGWDLTLMRDLSVARQDLAFAHSQAASLSTQLQETQQQVATIRGQQSAESDVLGGLAAGGKAWPMSPGEGSNGASGVVVEDPRSGRLLVHLNGLPALQTTEAYELWVQQGANMIPAGVIQIGDNGSYTLPLSANSSGVSAVALSLESAGGSKSPTGPVLLITKL